MNIKKFISDSGRVRSMSVRQITDEDYKNIIELTNFLELNPTLSQRIKAIYNDINHHPLCKVCNTNHCRYSASKDEVFRKTCSKECAWSDRDRVRKIIENTDYTKRNEKTKQTCLERYGVDSYNKTKEQIEKRESTCMARYGVKSVSQHAIIKQKKSDTRTKNKSSIQKSLKKSIEKRAIKNNWWWHDKIKLKKELERFNGCVLSLSSHHQIAFSTIYGAALKHGIRSKFLKSYGESELYNFLQSHNIESVLQNTRRQISPKELDFYLPNHKLAIEFNGMYWHSDIHKDKNYHLEKTELCNEKDIQLFHIFESEWIQKTDIVKSRILNKLGKTPNKIYARKCTINVVSTKECKKFLEENHIQGSTNSPINLGLFFNDELVSVMTFSKSRFSKKYEYELVRFCNKKYTNVVGGASRLFKYFVKNYNPVSIVSYADRRWSQGNLYKKLGFSHSHNSAPNYWYFRYNSIEVESRIKYQKHKLKNILEDFDPDLTEYENMINSGYLRIFDCGNSVWEWRS